MNLAELPHAYRSGKNPGGEKAFYWCHYCDLQLNGREVGYVAAGSNYANGEYSDCPRCGRENYTDRDEDY